MSALVYTSPNTWTGADPNAKFDADDELVFMARDAGVQAPVGTRPTGTAAGSSEAVRVTDPLVSGAEGYVYQALAPLPKFGDDYAVIGSWIVGDKPAGIGIREDATPITRNTSRFVPHYFE